MPQQAEQRRLVCVIDREAEVLVHEGSGPLSRELKIKMAESRLRPSFSTLRSTLFSWPQLPYPFFEQGKCLIGKGE